jgi:histidinol-phosphate phosphatase family protein
MAELVRHEPVGSQSQARPAVFLDRDGVINDDLGWISHPDQLELLPRAAEAIERLNRLGYLVIVVSNQSVVARGLATIDSIERIHQKLKTELDRFDARIDAFYICPHHPTFTGACDCRKPETGLIDQAAFDFGVDRDRSYLIGDSTGDILAGQRAGFTTILVRTGHGGRDDRYEVSPDLFADDLFNAVELIEKVVTSRELESEAGTR